MNITFDTYDTISKLLHKDKILRHFKLHTNKTFMKYDNEYIKFYMQHDKKCAIQYKKLKYHFREFVKNIPFKCEYFPPFKIVIPKKQIYQQILTQKIRKISRIITEYNIISANIEYGFSKVVSSLKIYNIDISRIESLDLYHICNEINSAYIHDKKIIELYINEYRNNLNMIHLQLKKYYSDNIYAGNDIISGEFLGDDFWEKLYDGYNNTLSYAKKIIKLSDSIFSNAYNKSIIKIYEEFTKRDLIRKGILF